MPTAVPVPLRLCKALEWLINTPWKKSMSILNRSVILPKTIFFLKFILKFSKE